jgi:hypothetical protein
VKTWDRVTLGLWLLVISIITSTPHQLPPNFRATCTPIPSKEHGNQKALGLCGLGALLRSIRKNPLLWSDFDFMDPGQWCRKPFSEQVHIAGEFANDSAAKLDGSKAVRGGIPLVCSP